MEETKPIYNKKRISLIFIIITNIVFVLAAIPLFFLWPFLVMMFDAPGSTSNPVIVSLFATIVSFPLVVILSFASWIFFAFKKYTFAVIISLIPLLSIFLAAILMGMWS